MLETPPLTKTNNLKFAQSLSVYLRWLIRYKHTLSSCDGVFYVLGMAVPFYSNQMTRRGDLSCRTEKEKKILGSSLSKQRKQNETVWTERWWPKKWLV